MTKSEGIVNNDNPIEDLTSSSIRVKNQDGKFIVFIETYFGAEIFEVGDDLEVISVKVKSAKLEIECPGFFVVPGSRLGDDTKPVSEEVSVETIIEANAMRQGRGGLNFGVRSGSGDLAASIDCEASKTESSGTKKSVQTTATQYRVRARGEKRWDISEIGDQNFLSGKYLGDSPLFSCRLSDKPTNRHSISASISVRARDLSFESLDTNGAFFKFGSKHKNRERLMNILLSKCVRSNELVSRNTPLEIVLSSCDCELSEKELT